MVSTSIRMKHMGFAGLSRSVRWLYSSATRSAREADIGVERIKIPDVGKPQTRQQKMDSINMRMQSKLFKLDNEFQIFSKSVRKVIDLGWVPGNWISYSKFRMCQIHEVEDHKFNEKCHILGFDILFGAPPPGVSTIQGNIYSKMAHTNILKHFQEIALRELDKVDSPRRYRNKSADIDIDDLARNLGNLSTVDIPEDIVEKGLAKRAQLLEKVEYRPDLILSDLGKPFMQQDGFFSQTNSRPYIRFNNNSSLNRPTLDPLKSSIDLGNASLYLSLAALKPSGTMVVRLPKVDVQDPELPLFHERLKQAFNSVDLWNPYGTKLDISESYFICRDKKKDDEIGTKEIFKN